MEADSGGPVRETGSSSTTATPPSVSRPSTASSVPTLKTPPVSTNNVHSSAELRYCLATDIRIEALRPQSNSNSEIDAFNRIVDDFNRRCGSFRYRAGALESARREVERYRAVIVENALDGLFLERSLVPDRRPALAASQDQSIDGSDRVAAIQEGLSKLGYDVGVVDGIYGSRTESAIKSFQQDYGMSVDGKVSSILLDQIGLMLNESVPDSY